MTETFKPKKLVLASEGFDPQSTNDPIYVEYAAANAYVRLDRTIYGKICSGEFRL